MTTYHLTYYASMDDMAMLLTDGVPSEEAERDLPADATCRDGNDDYIVHVIWKDGAPSPRTNHAAVVLATQRLAHRLNQTYL